MAVDISRATLEVERVVLNRTVKTPVEVDAMLAPATMPAVLMSEALAVTDAADVQTGSVLMASVDGHVLFQILLKTNAGLQCRSLRAPLREVIEQENVSELGAGARLTAESECIVESVAASISGGRLVARAIVEVHIKIVALEQITAISGITGVEGLNVRNVSASLLGTSADATVTSTFTDEFELMQSAPAPDAEPSEPALFTRARAEVSDVMETVGGVLVRGGVSLEVARACNLPGRPMLTSRHVLPFEQMVELPDWLRGDIDAHVNVLSTKATVLRDGSGEMLRAEAELRTQVRVLAATELSATSDAYATGATALTVLQRTVDTRTAHSKLRAMQQLKLKLPLPDGLPGASMILYSIARPSLMQCVCESGKANCDGVIEAQVVYLPVGSEEAAAAFIETPFNAAFQLTQNISGELQPGDIALDVTECECAPITSNQLELKCTLLLTGDVDESGEIVIALDAVAEEPKPVPRGITVLHMRPGQQLWDIAKDYRVPVEELQRMNPELTGEGAGRQVLVYRR